MNKNSSAAMIIKTIATDQQLDTRMSSPPRKTTQTVIEKSYLRSQFERRQRRQIELTNKMHLADRRDQPDLVASSHELAKRRFFDQLERRESINSARATQQITKAAQLHQQPHQQQQQRPTRTKSNANNKQAECSAIKVAANEPDGAGTDADEATSLETIITNSSSSRPNESSAAAPLNSLCKVPAPPLDNSKIGHDQQVQQVELRLGTSADGGRDERAQVAATRCLEESACAEQSSEMLAQELQPGRRPSKEEDLRRDRPQPIDDAVERLRPFSLHHHQQQQQEQQQREQYANPPSRPPLDGAQGSHGNNVNHDQYDGHRQVLNNSQEFAGMQFDGQKEGINLLGHDNELVPPVGLLHKSQVSLKSPDCESVQKQQVVGPEPGEQVCDAVRSCAPFLTMSSSMNRAQEEDVRSSCSSSGFGASVSAGSSASSSSEGQPERNRHHHHFERHSQTKGTDFERDEQVGSSVQYESFPLDGEFHLSQIDKGSDEIGQFEIFVGRLDAANSSHQTLSVGPERAHETDDERPMLHVENHGYGSLGNERLTLVKPEAKSACNKTKTMRNQTDKRRWPLVNAGDFTTELELDSSGQYVNLPGAANESAAADNQNSTHSMRAATATVSVSGSTAAAGYATVRARPTSLVSMGSRGQQAGAGLANIPPAGNNGHSPATGHESHNSGVLAKLNRHNSDEADARSGGGELEDRDSHLSGHNSCTSSASSGGFSKLPPVRLIDHNFANNFQFASSSSSSSKAPLERESQRPSARLELESNSIQQHQLLQSKRPTSLLKRFGSLVSRAFTSSNNLGGDANGAATRISANESKVDQCDGDAGGQSSAQVNAAARLETLQSSSTAMPLLKHQSSGSTNKLTNGISHAHKSIESATGPHAKDHHQEHRAKLLGAPDQRRGQQQARQTLKPLDQVKETALVGAGKSLAMAEADLIILSTKRSRNNYQAPGNRTTTGAIDDYYAPKSRRNTVQLARGSSEKVSSKTRRCSSRLEQANDNKSGKLTRETCADAFLLRRSVSSASCSSFTSLDNSSLTCSSTCDLSHRQRAAAPSGASRRQTRRERLHGTSLRRASSLSDELESLISPSELGVESQRIPAGESQLVPSPLDTCDGSRTKVSQKLGATTVNRSGNGGDPSGSDSTTEPANCAGNSPLAQPDGLAKSRSIMRWFSVNGSVGCSPSPVATNDDCNSIEYETGWPSREWESSCPRSHRYHDSKSLIDHSHADADCKLNCSKTRRNFAILSSKLQRRPTSKGTNDDGALEIAEPQPMSLVYSSLNLPNHLPHGGDEQPKQRQKRNSHWLKWTVNEEEANNELGDQLGEDELVVNDGKCQSLNLYQNLLRNYVKRRSHNHHRHHRHHNRGHHTHNHHHHHSSSRNNHHHNRSSSSRHAHCSSSAATATRCGQQQRCVSPARRACPRSSDQLSAVGNGKTHGDTASVWGQLIKINKSDGSQVIELERAAGRSWGFFVARGAINNEKGIFISRLNASSSGGRSLSGLLGVGDRIVSIDNYLIEPDFDILRVNQMISKRSKIFLEVKPFKG